jgi:hypothetical protein
MSEIKDVEIHCCPKCGRRFRIEDYVKEMLTCFECGLELLKSLTSGRWISREQYGKELKDIQQWG